MNPTERLIVWVTSFTATLVGSLTAENEERDRGDVPGWVMITVMTAIVVLALLTVFREQVVNAVQNAFQSVTGAA